MTFGRLARSIVAMCSVAGVAVLGAAWGAGASPALCAAGIVMLCAALGASVPPRLTERALARAFPQLVAMSEPAKH